jgi:hypothetical protein
MRILTCVVLAGLCAHSAQAQPDFSQVRATPGQHLVVTEDGLTFEGTLRALSAEGMTIGDREIVPGPGLLIERDNGHVVARSAGWGALGGALIGLAVMRGSARVPAALAMTLPGAFMGTMAGVASDSRTTLYDTTAAASSGRQLTVPAQPPPASPTFARLKIRPGDRVFIQDGAIVASGRVESVTSKARVVDGWTFTPHENLSIAKEGDPIWDGAAYGFVVGALLSETLGAESCIGQPPSRCALKAGIETAAFGALIDWSNKGRTVMYNTRPRTSQGAAAFLVRHVVPVVSGRDYSLAVVFRGQ